jgi:hypothetical protein
MSPVYAEEKFTDASEVADKGTYKWTVGATGDTREVVVLRWSRTWTVGDTKHISIHDTVSYNPGKRTEGSFVATLDKTKNQWIIQPFGGSGLLDAEYTNSFFGGNSGKINFKNTKGHTYDYEFSAFAITYKEAVTIYDGLPSDDTTGWKWAGEPKKGEQ